MTDAMSEIYKRKKDGQTDGDAVVRPVAAR